MFGDIGWAEMMLIGIVALVVIGPKDLPDLFRQLGRFSAKLRQMAREFQRAMEQAANDSGVKDVARDVGNLANPKSMGLDAVKSAADRFEKWDPLKNAATPTKPVTSGSIKGVSPAPESIAAAVAPAEAPIPEAPAAPVSSLTPVSVASHGSATQAAFDKKAARAAILRDTAEKLKAVEAEFTPEAAAEPVAEPAPKKPRKKKADPA